MIPIILMFIIVTIVTVCELDPYDFWEFISDAVLGMCLAVIPVLAYIVIQSGNIVEPAEQPVASETLVNINDASYSDTHGTTRGGLFYIYGSISTDNQQTFNYYVKQADGSFKLKSAPASDSTIVYTDGTPKVESTSYVCERGKVIFEPWSIASCKEKPTTYKFYIPEGSIVEGYKLGE